MRVVRVLLCILILVLLLYFLSCFLKEAQTTPVPQPQPEEPEPAPMPQPEEPEPPMPQPEQPALTPAMRLLDTLVTVDYTVYTGRPGIRLGFAPQPEGQQPAPMPQPEGQPAPMPQPEGQPQTVVGVPIGDGGAVDLMAIATTLQQLGMGTLVNWAGQNYPPIAGQTYTRPALPSTADVVQAQPMVVQAELVTDAGITDLNRNTTPRNNEHLQTLDNNILAALRLDPVVANKRNPEPDHLLRIFARMIAMHFEIGRRTEGHDSLVRDESHSVAGASLRRAYVFRPGQVKMMLTGNIPREQGTLPNNIQPYQVLDTLIDHFRQLMNGFDPGRGKTIQQWAEYLYEWVVTEGWEIFGMGGRPYINKFNQADILPNDRPDNILDDHPFRDQFVNRLVMMIIDMIERVRISMGFSCGPQTPNGRIG